MVIDCSRCAYRATACADCVVPVITEKETFKGPRRGRELDIKDVTGADHALGAQELRALNVLARAGLVAPLRYRPTPVGEQADAIVAL
jgi:hypothetical protein